jgi:adenosylhomocysteine nucleosidase
LKAPQAEPPTRRADEIGSPLDVALFFAMPEEAWETRRRVSPHLIGGDGRLHGDWEGRTVRLQETGPGPRQAEAAARRMLGGARPRLVVCAGLAGGLHPALSRGNVVAAEQVVGLNGERYPGDGPTVETAVRLGARRGTLLTVPRVVTTVEEKRALSARAALVDMESLAVARVAAENDVPFVAIRVISDAASEGFPIDLNRYIDGEGQIRRVPLALAALGRPGGLGFLLGLRATTRAASLTLAAFLHSLIQSIFPSSLSGFDEP